jgi:predicted permease
MKLGNVRIISTILLFAQLRLTRQGIRQSWYRTYRGLVVINVAVFVATFALVYAIMTQAVTSADIGAIQPIAVQLLSMIPLVTIALVVIYGILFVIGESAQYSSSEMINYMPITSTEYVLGSSLSTVMMYLFILTAVLGISLGIALPLGYLSVWILSAVMATFFMVVGGFVAEIIRALVNRVSSSFSKRGGRSAIISRAILIVLVLAVFQLLFNINLLYKVIQILAPQMQAYWFVPFFWPSLSVVYSVDGMVSMAAIFTGLTLALGFGLMGAAVLLRARYWVPLPVTIKLSSSKAGTYQGTGMLGRLGFTQGEVAMIRKDTRSIFRRKEMVRFLAVPIIIMVPLLFTIGSGDASGNFYTAVIICLMGEGMFGLFLSIMNLGQEGPAVWHILSSPLDARSLFRAKITAPLLISLVPAVALPIVISVIMGFSVFYAASLMIAGLAVTILAVLFGSYLSPKYADFEEKPRNTYVRGTGMFIGLLGVVLISAVCVSPIVFYILGRGLALSIGFNKFAALGATVAIAIVAAILLYYLAKGSISELYKHALE